MSPINVLDESYIAADRARVAGAVADPSWWPVVWPELLLTVTEDRGLDGVRWAVAGRLTGTAEVWLEDFRGRGVIVHYFLRVDQDGAISDRRARRLCRRYALRWKEHVFALKDTLESTV